MNEPRTVEEFRPGYFLTRLARNGPPMPARIWRPCTCTVNGEIHDWRETCDRYPPLIAEIAGVPAALDKVWLSRTEITEAEFIRLTALQHEPDDPRANPKQAVDLRAMKAIW